MLPSTFSLTRVDAQQPFTAKIVVSAVTIPWPQMSPVTISAELRQKLPRDKFLCTHHVLLKGKQIGGGYGLKLLVCCLVGTHEFAGNLTRSLL